MKKEKKILVSIEIDKLTNSIENVVSGDIFDTDVIQLFSKDTRQINKTDWQFNWQGQLKLSDREVYKLVIIDNLKNSNSKKSIPFYSLLKNLLMVHYFLY